MTKTEIAQKMRTPALLEQVAEECMELAHACIKMARKIRWDGSKVNCSEIPNNWIT